MWISTKAQYGLRALVEIAVADPDPTSLKAVAERQQLSHQYLEQIFAPLRRGGIVESMRGAHGGYRLARSPETVTCLEVVELLEGTIAPVICIDEAEACARTGSCATEALWRRVEAAVRSELSDTTVGDLLHERQLLQIEPLPAFLAFG